MAANKLITDLRTECLKRGCGGIKGLGVVFRQMDADFSKRLCFEEFQQGMKTYGIPLGEENMKLLFKEFDRDRNGSIDFCEFMHNLRPPMPVVRINVINQAFDKLDVNKDQVIKVDDLQVVYAANARKHPKFLSGEWTEEETLRNFLDGLDTPGCPDGKVTRDEFLNYYAGVSAMVEDDCYFDLMLRSCYGLPPKGSS